MSGVTLSLAVLLFAALARMNAQQPGPPTVPPWSPGMLDIHQIQTGRGNAAFLIFPDGTTMLIDAGAVPDRPGPQLGPQRPDRSQRPGQTVARYILRHAKKLDYALITHYHDDHMGALSVDAPMAAGSGYRLTGITDVAELVPIGKLIDRGNSPAPATNPMIANYQRFRATFGAKAEVLAAGRADQIVPVNQPRADFEVRNLAANGLLWTGSGNESRSAFPAGWESLPADDRPNENHFSAAIRVRYGRFDYYTGGDLIGVPLDGVPGWHDIETPLAKAVGAVDVCVLDHHGWLDSTNEFFLATLRPRVIVLPAWHATHPDHGVLRRILSKRSYPGPRDLFATTLLDAPKAIFSYLGNPFASQEGHVLIRVSEGGKSYRVLVLDDNDEQGRVVSTHGPYESR